MSLTVGVITENQPGERRVAVVPDVAKKLAAGGARLVLQTGAAAKACIPESGFQDVDFMADAGSVLDAADLILKVQPPTMDEISQMRAGSVLVGYMQPHARHQEIRALADRRITGFAMELVPRISRAQSMDALSSQASAAGYKAVLLGATELDRFMPMLTTAAGTIRPAHALVIGAGVAGLQAIATARRLGAIVEAFDVRSSVKEQIESLGAKFLDTGVTAEGEGGYARELTEEEKQKQREVLEQRIAKADLVITTAAVPGRPAPRIVSRATVERMRPGSVLVDLGAESGGNCELTQANQTVVHQDVKILGPVNLASTLAGDSSAMYARNLLNFIQPAIKDGELSIDWEDEVFASSVLTRDGQVVHEPTAAAMAAAARPAQEN